MLGKIIFGTILIWLLIFVACYSNMVICFQFVRWTVDGVHTFYNVLTAQAYKIMVAISYPGENDNIIFKHIIDSCLTMLINWDWVVIYNGFRDFFWRFG